MTETKTKKKMHNHWYTLLMCIVVFAVIGIGFLLLSAFGVFRYWQAEKIEQGETTLSFSSASLPFTHVADLENSLPFLAGAAFDADGDGIDELFLGGGDSQADQLFKFQNGGFVATNAEFPKEAIDATHGAASIDIDNDGDVDLYTARESGIWFHENVGTSFASKKLPIELADNTTPLSIGFGDINQDGLADMYIAGYIKIELVEGETIFAENYGGYSYLMLNEGDNQWKDISKEAGVWRQHNTFLGVFTDLDNDFDSDLVIAQDTGKVEMYENTGDFPFKPISNPSVYSYPMGVAVGDYDNDGLVDLFFSNVGYTLPAALLKGDLGEDDPFNMSYMLFHNDGDLNFSDTAETMKVAKLGFGWGTVSADMNLDGREDLLAAQNYARLPGVDLLERYTGKLLQNYGSHFAPVEVVAGAENSYFGIAPIVSDFNNDGWPDLVWTNLDGPALAYINNGGDENWLKVRLPNNADSLNAIVTLDRADGTTLSKQFITSQGLGSDQGRDLIFGLGSGTAQRVTVQFQNGTKEVFETPASGTTIQTKAGN